MNELLVFPCGCVLVGEVSVLCWLQMAQSSSDLLCACKMVLGMLLIPIWSFAGTVDEKNSFLLGKENSAQKGWRERFLQVFFFAVPNFFLSYSPRDTESCTAVLPSRDPSSPVQLWVRTAKSLWNWEKLPGRMWCFTLKYLTPALLSLWRKP